MEVFTSSATTIGWNGNNKGLGFLEDDDVEDDDRCSNDDRIGASTSFSFSVWLSRCISRVILLVVMEL
jgi:hypothetical protein